MATEATREMFSDELVEAMENLHMYPRLIAERAAKEAVAVERVKIAEAVRGLPSGVGRVGSRSVSVVDRAAVLAIVEGEKP